MIGSEVLPQLPPAAYLPKRPVWVAREVLASEHAVATQRALLDAIAQAVDTEAPVGIEHAPERVAWDVALKSLGLRVYLVPGWLARLAALLRLPVLYRDPSSKVVVQLGYEDVARALGALPSGRPA
jgi:hypothetical protein